LATSSQRGGVGRAWALRELISTSAPLVVPGAPDVLSALVIEDCGFPAVWIGGYATSAAVLGEPDVNLLTMTEQLEVVRRIAGRVRVPVLADCDDGYGEAANVARAVRDFEAAGAAAIQLEDQALPQRTSASRGRRSVRPAEEHAERVRVAVESRRDPDTLIFARSDALGAGFGVDEALHRGELYVDAGAVGLMFTARSYTDLTELAQRWDREDAVLAVAPTLFPERTTQELGEAGFKIIIHATFPLQAMMAGLRSALTHLNGHGHISDYRELLPTAEISRLVEEDRVATLERDYGVSPHQLVNRYCGGPEAEESNDQKV
jgi:phosphoenolpyruvate phosphomutase